MLRNARILMLVQALFLLACGVVGVLLSDRGWDQRILGSYSAILLVGCGILSGTLHRTGLVPRAGYWIGAGMSLLVGLNFARLACKWQGGAAENGVDPVLAAIMGVGSLIIFILILEAPPHRPARLHSTAGTQRLRMPRGKRHLVLRLVSLASLALVAIGWSMTYSSGLVQVAAARVGDAIGTASPLPSSTEASAPSEISSIVGLVVMGLGCLLFAWSLMRPNGGRRSAPPPSGR